MKFRVVFILSVLIIVSSVPRSYCQTRQQLQAAAADIVNGVLETQLGTQYKSLFVVDVDSVLGNASLYPYPVEDPHGLLKHCFIFIGGRSASRGNFLGVYREGRILWLSDTTILGWQPQLFTVTDLNRSGQADIMVESDNDWPSSQLWIFGWDGHTGKRISAVDSVGESVLTSIAHSFELFDGEGDGVIEIRDGNVADGSRTWSWNGEEFGSWPTTPHLPSTTLWPRNKIIIGVHCSVTETNGRFYYRYVIENRRASLQKVNEIRIWGRCDSVTKIVAPYGWTGGYNNNGGGDGAFFAYWSSNITGHTDFIYPGRTEPGFATIACCLPSIVEYDGQGYNDLPDYKALTGQQIDELQKEDETSNSVHGFTISPVELPAPFVPLDFIDTLISYENRSVTLGWLRNDRSREQECEQTVRNKDWYVKEEVGKIGRWGVNDSWDFDRDWNGGLVGILDKRLDMAKRMLTRGDSVQARRDLQIFVMEVELVEMLGKKSEARSQKQEARGEKPVMSSEAYALLKYNAEYLIDRLPERNGRHEERLRRNKK